MRKKQVLFLQNFAKLIIWANSQPGYEVTAGELYRTEEQHAYNLKHGKTLAKRSKHQDRMAGDLNLFINGVYQTDTKAYKPLGDYWNSLHKDNVWGGDFNDNGIYDDRFLDGNHFEIKL